MCVILSRAKNIIVLNRKNFFQTLFLFYFSNQLHVFSIKYNQFGFYSNPIEIQ